jgi:hypothetical protein
MRYNYSLMNTGVQKACLVSHIIATYFTVVALRDTRSRCKSPLIFCVHLILMRTQKSAKHQYTHSILRYTVWLLRFAFLRMSTPPFDLLERRLIPSCCNMSSCVDCSLWSYTLTYSLAGAVTH